MKKMIAALVAALLMVTMIVPAMAEIQLGLGKRFPQVFF